MITEKNISNTLKREIKSPIRIGDVRDLGLDTTAFLDYFQPVFEDLQDDLYLVRERQIAFLKRTFPTEVAAIEAIHQPYYEGKTSTAVVMPWVAKLSEAERALFLQASMVTRQRSIASFSIAKSDGEYTIERVHEDAFAQEVDDNRSWKRVFQQATEKAVENPLFYQLLKGAFQLVASIHPEIQKLKITGHFMRTLTKGEVKGENSPEGMHEDGSPYIISALVVNRKNITGGETQIFEKLKDTRELIFAKELDPGAFAFQADTGEERTFGNDLWHYVTPIQPIDLEHLGIRDILGLDIAILE